MTKVVTKGQAALMRKLGIGQGNPAAVKDYSKEEAALRSVGIADEIDGGIFPNGFTYLVAMGATTEALNMLKRRRAARAAAAAKDAAPTSVPVPADEPR
jgi:hypothetical protein